MTTSPSEPEPLCEWCWNDHHPDEPFPKDRQPVPCYDHESDANERDDAEYAEMLHDIYLGHQRGKYAHPRSFYD